MNMGKRMAAEFFGTFWLVLGGCGSAVLAAGFPELGIGFAGVALFQGGWAVEQLWFFWVMPIVGAVIGGLVYRYLWSDRPAEPAITGDR
jgi:glycerol uptake facilitator-like aquaporin